MRVVNVIGFKRGFNLLKELLGLAKPFGKVVKHLVLDLRPEVRAGRASVSVAGVSGGVGVLRGRSCRVAFRCIRCFCPLPAGLPSV